MNVDTYRSNQVNDITNYVDCRIFNILNWLYLKTARDVTLL